MAALWGGGRGTSRERFQDAAPKANLEGASPPAHRDSEPPVYKVFRETSGDAVTHHPPFTCSLSLSLPSEQNPPSPPSLAFTITQSKKQEQKVRAEAISRQNLFSH